MPTVRERRLEKLRRLRRRAKALVVEQANVAERIARVKAWLKAHPVRPRAKAVKWAVSKVGITEGPPGSNRGPEIDVWQRFWLGWAGYQWCGAFAGFALMKAGVQGIVGEHIVYTPSIVNDAKAGRNGFRRWVTVEEIRMGDLVLFDWDGGGVDHVGIATGRAYRDVRGTLVVPTVEGNTSSDNAGSQSNGGGVFRRVRPASTIAGGARPKWR